jgi:hypothetical protein
MKNTIVLSSYEEHHCLELMKSVKEVIAALCIHDEADMCYLTVVGRTKLNDGWLQAGSDS